MLTLRRWAVWRWLAVAAALPQALAALLGDPPTGSALAALLVGVGLSAALWRSAPPPVVWLSAAVPVVAGAITLRALDDGTWLLDGTGWVLLALAGLPAMAAVAGAGRAAGSGLATPCAWALAAPTAVLAATGGDGLTVLGWWPAAGALGLTALLRGRRSTAAGAPQVDAVDGAAMAAFERDHGPVTLAPVVVVVAAYNEAQGLPGVLAGLPTSVCGLITDVLVIDDGSTDGTAESARAAGRGYVVACSANRGQGAALRLGYRIARSNGAAYVLTTDADGQYDVADLPAVLQPILDGRADFVTGSRVLGALHNHDRVRELGTHVFAWLATVLLGRRMTDTSFGLRAMRADVTGAVTLNQPQYQASELLVGVASHGFRILEVPGTMHRRAAGSTKKGGNLVYGSRYARVMLGTWVREGAPRPVGEVAPALDGGRDGRAASAAG